MEYSKYVYVYIYINCSISLSRITEIEQLQHCPKSTTLRSHILGICIPKWHDQFSCY